MLCWLQCMSATFHHATALLIDAGGDGRRKSTTQTKKTPEVAQQAANSCGHLTMRLQREKSSPHEAFCCAGNVPAPTPAVKESQSPIRQSPWPSSPSQGSVHLPDMPSADRSALLHAIDLPALQQEPSLTALISPDSSARTGTFTPPGAGAALTCRVPELVSASHESACIDE